MLTTGATGMTVFRDGPTLNGLDSTETTLTPANVTPATFGQLYSTPVDGQVYAQPLVVPGVDITVGSSQGVHDVVIVATEHDSVYAIDSSTGAILWQTSFLNAAEGITSVPSSYIQSSDISPEYGITSTPAIDTATNTMYVVANTAQDINGVVHVVYTLHALDLSTGAETDGGPVTIADTSWNGTDYTDYSGPQVDGTGSGSVNGVITFNAIRELQRSALMIVGNNLYMEFGSHSDIDPYHGWILGYDISTLAPTAVFCDTPNGDEGGIWDGGAGISVDAEGNLYIETGNGTFDTDLNSAGFPSQGDYGDSVIKLVPDPSSSASNPNINGWGLQVADYFTPSDQEVLAEFDKDFGSQGLVLLPASMGTAATPNLAIAAGKEGTVYVLNLDNMGKFSPTSNNVVQEIDNGFPGEILGTPAVFDNTVYYIGAGDTVKAFPMVNGQLQTPTTSTFTFGYPGGSPSISSNGTADGILWATDVATSQLIAYNANNLDDVLYSSNDVPADELVGASKFLSPTVADGQVYLGTQSSLTVYGLLGTPCAVPTSPPAASDLTATSNTAGTQVTLKWEDNSAGVASFQILQSTDGVNYAPIGTCAAGVDDFHRLGIDARHELLL